MTVIMARMFKHCFQKCAGTSGDGLDEEEMKCLARCQDRFLDVRKAVQDSLHDRDIVMKYHAHIVSDDN